MINLVSINTLYGLLLFLSLFQGPWSEGHVENFWPFFTRIRAASRAISLYETTSTQQTELTTSLSFPNYRINHINIRNIKVTRDCLDSIADSGYYQRLEYLVHPRFFDGHIIFQQNKQIITLCYLAQYVPHAWEPWEIRMKRSLLNMPNVAQLFHTKFLLCYILIHCIILCFVT